MNGDLFELPPLSAKPRVLRARVTPAKKTKRRNVGLARKTGGSSQALEYAITALTIAGFHLYDNFKHYEAAKDNGTLHPLYIIKHYPCPTLYGTKGKKEGFISHKGNDYIFEAKYQEGSGSVDEKPPYVWECFLVSNVPNWIVWFDGDWWVKSDRGIAAVAWLRERVRERCPADRRLIVLNQKKEAREFLRAEFGGHA